jgi:hypothetical protein
MQVDFGDDFGAREVSETIIMHQDDGKVLLSKINYLLEKLDRQTFTTRTGSSHMYYVRMAAMQELSSFSQTNYE